MNLIFKLNADISDISESDGEISDLSDGTSSEDQQYKDFLNRTIITETSEDEDFVLNGNESSADPESDYDSDISQELKAEVFEYYYTIC